MKNEGVVIMFLFALNQMSCQSSNVESDRQAIVPSKPTLFQTSDQSDSSQGNAMPAEPIEKDPTNPTAEMTAAQQKKSSYKLRMNRPRSVNPETTPAMESNSRF